MSLPRRQHGRATIVAALLSCGLTVAAPAVAAPPSTTELEAARGAFAEGLAFEAQNRWAEALDRFQRASAVRASPQVSFHVGLCFEHTGRLVDALNAFVRVERDAVGDSSARRTGQLAERHVAALRKRLPVLVLRAPPSEGEIAVLLDGHPVQSAMLDVPIPVDPGEHTLVVRADGRASTEERVVAREAERVEVSLRVGAELPKAPAVAAAPVLPERTQVAPAPPRVQAAVPMPRPLAPPSRSWLTTPLVLGGGAVVSFAAAGTFYGLRASAIGELRAGCAEKPVCPDDLRSVRDRGQTFTTAGNVALAIAATATVAATVTFFVLRPMRRADVALVARGPLLLLEGSL